MSRPIIRPKPILRAALVAAGLALALTTAAGVTRGARAAEDDPGAGVNTVEGAPDDAGAPSAAPPEGGGGEAEASAEEFEAEGADPGREYSPWLGMDRNGRIPKVELPPDIDKPERWRYIPEGRIKPGNVFQRFLVSSFIVPVVFANQDVGVGAGIGVTDIDFRQQRRREFAGLFFTYTSKGQQRYGIAWRRMLKTRDLPTGGVIQEERSWVRVRASYSKTLTRRFFGFGPDRLAIQESSYTDEAVFLGASWSSSMPKPVDDLVIELGADVQLHNLWAGTVQGVPSLNEAYPLVYARWPDYDMGILSAEVRWDTRDAQRNPYRGYVVGARVDAPLIQTNLDTGAIFTLFGSYVHRVPALFHDGGDPDEQHPPTDTLAFALFGQATAGSVPFYLMPSLGGRNTLRGFIQGRWRDRAAWHGSVEYRFWVLARGFPITRNIRVERVGLALFYDVGAVAPTVSQIFHSRVSQSFGTGIRVSLERSAIFRLDFGFGPERGVPGVQQSFIQFNFIAGFGLSF